MICKTCKKDKDSENFYKHPTNKSGFIGVCKKCIRKNKELKDQSYDDRGDPLINRILRAKTFGQVWG